MIKLYFKMVFRNIKNNLNGFYIHSVLIFSGDENLHKKKMEHNFAAQITAQREQSEKEMLKFIHVPPVQ